MAEGNTARLGLDEELLGGYYQTLALSFVLLLPVMVVVQASSY
jgi:hypothetical protein